MILKIGADEITAFASGLDDAEKYYFKNCKYAERIGNDYAFHYQFIEEFKRIFDVHMSAKDITILTQTKEYYQNLINSKTSVDVKLTELLSKIIKKPPFEFQKKGVNYLWKAGKAILADDVGLGKTIQMIAVYAMYRIQNNKKLIIVCPATIKHQWKNELLDFIDIDKEKICIIEGSKEERCGYYSLSHKYEVFILNYENFLYDSEEIQTMLYKTDFGMCVLDEASRIKNSTSKTTSKILGLLSHIPRRYCLTATPIENSLFDVHSMMKFINRNVLGSDKFFKDRYSRHVLVKLHTPIVTKSGRKITAFNKHVGFKNLDEVKTRLEPYVIRRCIDEIEIQLPEVTFTNYTVELSKTQKMDYNDIKEKILASKYDESQKVVVIAEIMRLKEICDSTLLLDAEKELELKEHSPKLCELKELLETEIKNEKIVIFSQFRKFTDIIVKELHEYNPLYIHGGVEHDKREIIKNMFSENKNMRLLVMTEAGERGLNLQKGRILINMDLPWNPAKLKQRIGRIFRIGSEHKTIRVLNFITHKTVEESIIEKLQYKQELFEEMFSSAQHEHKSIESLSTNEILKLIS